MKWYPFEQIIRNGPLTQRNDTTNITDDDVLHPYIDIEWASSFQEFYVSRKCSFLAMPLVSKLGLRYKAPFSALCTALS